MTTEQWQFWIDRGGTFTDVIAKTPNGELKVCKLLSENPRNYQDAAVQGIKTLLDDVTGQSVGNIESIKMGTTVATNALLERQGEPSVLVITKGFADALRIGYQNRPHLFKLAIKLPELLYSQVIEVDERIAADGQILKELDQQNLTQQLQQAFDNGLRSCAIVLMHGYRYYVHESVASKIAQDIGFTQVSVSHQVNPLMKIVGRGDTTVVDSYLTPVLKRYVQQFTQLLDGCLVNDDCRVQFMQSNGGLTDANAFAGKDAVLSGPAGGVVAMVETAKQAGFNKIIGLDMGGTSTDVALYDGEYERTFDTQVAGVRIQAPMMNIHTVAAGGGSILSFDGSGSGLRLNVGPESAGANPGPKAYRNQGPLAVTDINLLLGKLQSDFFPAIFGPNQDQALDLRAVQHAFTQLVQEQKLTIAIEQLAQGYLDIAVEHMANAIKHISVQRGIDVADYTLCCFGGAGAQHACLVANALGMETVFIHQLSSVLSAYGMGLAQVRQIEVHSVEAPLVVESIKTINQNLAQLNQKVSKLLVEQKFSAQDIELQASMQLKYQGTDTSLTVNIDNQALTSSAELALISNSFKQQHQQRYGFSSQARIIVESIQIEGIGHSERPLTNKNQSIDLEVEAPKPCDIRSVYFHVGAQQGWRDTPFYRREQLTIGCSITGPAIVIEPQTTIVVEPHWTLQLTANNDLVLRKEVVCEHGEQRQLNASQDIKVDPIRLELFNNLFMFIAEQMGLVLKNTATSVNIKERLDFSCALFNHKGELVANAPHMPVHLGSMGESVKSVAEQNAATMQAGDVYLINSPFHGGSHLPDLTVVTPVFDQAGKIEFYVASRGHHADVGGLTPGSMPPNSDHISQEGILFDNFLLVRDGEFQQQALLEKLTQHQYPARNPQQNIIDLKAQIAANQKGINQIRNIQKAYGADVVAAYMDHMLDAAESSVKQAISQLSSGAFCYRMDDGSQIQVKITIDDLKATVDFTGSSVQQATNFNAPYAVVKAAVLYVFRTLVDKDIPLNAGCLRPIELIVPQGSMLHPSYPAAVVAGNVETSQAITDAIYGALGISAGSQGTMNNFTFGDEQYQYYETICGGTGAGIHGNGCDAVQSHMTNSRLTDPEVLEWRFPVLLKQFAIRQGSGGEGEYQGGNGVVREIAFNQPMEASILANRRKIAPFGINGGANGAVGESYVTKANGQMIKLDSCDHCHLDVGDSITIKTPGGGGYGKK